MQWERLDRLAFPASSYNTGSRTFCLPPEQAVNLWWKAISQGLAPALRRRLRHVSVPRDAWDQMKELKWENTLWALHGGLNIILMWSKNTAELKEFRKYYLTVFLWGTSIKSSASWPHSFCVSRSLSIFLVMTFAAFEFEQGESGAGLRDDL